MKLNYKSFGSGVPIIIVHGLMGSLDNWQTIAMKLADQYKVSILDMRNHGKSPHDDQMSYSVMAQDIIEFMDDHQIEKAHLVGHSMGGQAVMEVAAHEPSRVLKLVIVDINPFTTTGDHETIINGLLSLNISSVKSRADADEKLSNHINEWGVRQLLLKNLERNPEGGFKWKFNLDVIDRQYDAIREGINLKWPYNGDSLVVRGAKSLYVTDDDMESIRDKMINVAFNTVEDAGHWVHADQPEAFLEVLKGFLAS